MEEKIDDMNDDLKNKISEKDKAKLKYKQKLELIKQHYGVDFDITYFKDESIDKIKFSNLEYKNTAKNITVVFDNHIGKFNYLFYDYDSEQMMKNYNDKKIINGLNREKKLKLVVAEIRRLDEEYKRKLSSIEEKYQSLSNESNNELELRKKVENT